MTSHNEPWRVISGNFRTRVLVRAGHCMCLMHGNHDGVVCYAHIAMQHARMSSAKQHPVSLQVMSIVAITTAALGPTVFAPAAGKEIMPPEVRMCDSMLSQAYKRWFRSQGIAIHLARCKLQGPDEQQMPGFEKKGALLDRQAILDAMHATLDRR